ncbi:MAG: hypothetical protein ACRD2I_00880 [Vicinamibacterales bacterium]
MKFGLPAIALLVGLVAGLVWPLIVSARGQVVMSDRLRFRMVGDEPIASPDGRSLMPGMKVIVLRDTKSDQCYVSFVMGSAMSTTGPSVCP